MSIGPCGGCRRALAAALWAALVVFGLSGAQSLAFHGELSRSGAGRAPSPAQAAGTAAVYFSSKGSGQAASGVRTFRSNASAPSAPPGTPAPEQRPPQVPSAGGMTAEELEMLRLINQARRSAGVAEVVADARLNQVARLKAEDLLAGGYWSHYSPTYGSPADMLRAFGIDFAWVGENLARAPDVQQAFQGLMNSPTHRSNILYPYHRLVGVAVLGYQQWGRRWVLVVQEFVTPSSRP